MPVRLRLEWRGDDSNSDMTEVVIENRRPSIHWLWCVEQESLKSRVSIVPDGCVAVWARMKTHFTRQTRRGRQSPFPSRVWASIGPVGMLVNQGLHASALRMLKQNPSTTLVFGLSTVGGGLSYWNQDLVSKNEAARTMERQLIPVR